MSTISHDPESLQARQLIEVLSSLKRGDLTQRMPMDQTGLHGKVCDLLNDIIDQNDRMVREFERISDEVGREGKISHRIAAGSSNGYWGACIDSVNNLIGNLVQPNTEVTRVIGAVASGDLSQYMSLDFEGIGLKGEFLRTATIVNTMVDQLNSFASEVTRVAREVGTEGKLGGQADVPGVGGTWKDLTDNVNSMASNLTGQVRDIAEVTKAVATGDLSKKITVDVKGELLELKNTINTMVDQLNSFASEVTRVAREVGTEGILGGQADVQGVAGTWKDLTDSVNSMASNLTGQVRNIADVTTAVARGDLSKKITVDVKGEILELKNTINTMVDQLNSFASEVTRVAKEVGTEGELGGQANVRGVAGTWKDLTDSVNSMASNLTGQVRNIADVTTAVANGDLSKKITVDVKGEILELKITINTMVDQLSSFASEVTRVAKEVGTDGKLGGQAEVRGVAGIWKDLTDSVNSMASNLTGQVRNIAAVTTAVARGDLSKKITVDVKGEILELKDTINTMVDQLNSFASEVTRVAKEVGTEGKLGGQAEVRGVAGTWKDLTDSVNFMANNLTTQVRGIAKVVTSVANGDLKKKLYFEAKGEIAELSDTINNMIDTLALFGDQVTTVAREVGIEGKLGGQASVPGAAGLWRDLTDNVNQLASNLTTQVRAIAEVATGVTKGDLSRTVTVKAAGEVAALSDNINEMIRNLRETTRINTEQDWLKTNLAKFTRILQGQRNLVNVSKLILTEMAPLVSAQHGAFYITENQDNEVNLKLLASYASQTSPEITTRFRPGEGLIGQCFLNRERILLSEVPREYIQISSGLGQASPLSIVVLPVLFEGEVKAVIELASFPKFPPITLNFLDQLTESIGIVLNTIAAGMRTEELLLQSQTLTEELQGRQEQLTKTNQRLEEQANSLKASEDLLKEQREELQAKNEELEEKARLLARKNHEVERKNIEVEQARRSLEEKARQLALTSRYKSEFLANMSHELRTPLNNMLILSRLLYDNEQENLSSKQIEYARTIHGSGNDLLQLINDILDLSKIESGKMPLEVEPVSYKEIAEYLEKSFKEGAKEKGLQFSVIVNSDLSPHILTDLQRLKQVMRNLLSNALKFTHQGGVQLKIDPVTSGWNEANEVLNTAEQVVAFSVIDTGIGIPLEKQNIIFEAFRQADGGTSRKYGGTGLGLSISKEISRILGGELGLESGAGIGSTFTLFLPNPYPSTESSTDHQDERLFSETEYRRFTNIAKSHHNKLNTEEGAKVHRMLDTQNLPELVLIIEDDAPFAELLADMARSHGFNAMVAGDGQTALSLLDDQKISAIMLDIRLPDMEGWVILERIKRDSQLRQIPVHVVSVENEWRRSLQMGAIAHIAKPVDKESLDRAFEKIQEFLEREATSLLIVDGDDSHGRVIAHLIGTNGVTSKIVTTGNAAVASIRSESFDCIVLQTHLPDMSGFDLIREIKDQGFDSIPIVIYTDTGLNSVEESQIRKLKKTNIVTSVASPEKLVAETALYLHRSESEYSMPPTNDGDPSFKPDPVLKEKKVLIVDDDVRNIFALTSLLEKYEMQISFAENAKDGIEILKNDNQIDIVLMDVMMPDMDGYAAMQTIRGFNEFKDLPVIALTAKAMKGDREKCIEAGASDYVTKPVSIDQLLGVLRHWCEIRNATGRRV